MEDDSNNIENYEEILKKLDVNKPLALYSGREIRKPKETNTKTVQDILSDVAKQMKAIQDADFVSKRETPRKINISKQGFVPVNMLPKYLEVPQQKNTNFDTQSVSDTQLFNVIQDAEALESHKGVTQEFENSFFYGKVQSIDCTDKYSVCVGTVEIEDKRDMINKEDIGVDKVYPSQNENYSENRTQTEPEFNIIDITLKEPDPIYKHITETSNEHLIEDGINLDSAEIFNECIEIQEDIEMPSSPIFNVKPTIKTLTQNPLVFDLEAFETFENVALPLLEQCSDFETAKFLINSQIIGKELSIQTDGGPILNEDCVISPVLHNAKNSRKDETVDIFALDSQETEEPKSLKSSDSDKFIFKDEILFSSDEEDYVHKDIKDLPFTCALETSFYSQSEVLDKTMYVGFQTASNKSIQIGIDSFSKANRIFEDVDRSSSGHEPTFADLVEMCDLVKSTTNVDFTDLNKQVMDIESIDVNQTTEDNMNISPFKTASGKSIEITKESVIKSDVKESSTWWSPKVQQVSKLVGFRTASNQVIKLSDIALEKSKNLFQDICLEDVNIENVSKTTDDLNKAEDRMEIDVYKDQRIDDDILQEFQNSEMSQVVKYDNNNSVKQTSFASFKTADNKDIKISDNALAKTKQILQNIDFTDTDTDLSHTSEPKQEDVLIDEAKISYRNECEENAVIGFKKATFNKENIISEESLLETKEFDDIDCDNPRIGKDLKERENPLQSDVFKQPSTSKAFIGFKTANNKENNISEEALSKTKKVFQDLEKDIGVDNVVTNEMQFQGFKTASNKKVEISAVALAKSKNFFENDNINDEVVDFRVKDNESTKSFTGFKTASNKNVKISEEALTKSKSIFKDIELTDAINKAPVKDMSNKHSEMFEGFQTANKKPVTISAEALAKSKSIFQDICKTISVNDAESNYTVPHYKGFQTASNKAVKISDEALERSRKVFQDINEEICSNKDVQGKTQSKFQGFQTANNIEVKISEDALVKSKKIFEGIGDPFDEDSTEKATSFKGFQTASNKEVAISEQALAKSKQLFQDLNFDDQTDHETVKANADILKKTDKIQDLKLSKPKSDIFGFQTGNNNKIEISKEALHKSRKLFGDLDDQNNYTTNKDKTVKDINVENIINTQVLNNFEETLNSEDFCKDRTPVNIKRSGSPILSCPKAKRRKIFEIPYSQHVIKELTDNKDTTNLNLPKPETAYTFDENYKKNKKYHLKDLQSIERNLETIEKDLESIAKSLKKAKTSIDKYFLNFNYDNLLDFEFIGPRNDITDVRWTLTDLKNSFLDSVNKKFIPEGWLDNHLKLILWKLISYEIKFPNAIGIVCTAKNVIEQLKYRYDKELYNAERPALRKILEKDDTSGRTMVLCVVALCEDDSVTSKPTNNIELLLTDGWYCLRTCTDKMITQLVKTAKIVVGTKIVTSGAELLNCEQGVAPWEGTSSIRLKIFGNSTRRARWDARLGFHGNAVATPLAAVTTDGGKVAKLRAFVTRVYPALYVEKLPDGSTVTRSERLEYFYQMKHESERQATLEKIYEEVEKEFSEQDSPDLDDQECSSKRGCLESGSQIAKVMKTSRDPSDFRSHLTESQRTLLQDHTTKQREKLLQDIQRRVEAKIEKNGLAVNRNVIVLLKIRVAGVEERRGNVKVTTGMMSIWKANEAVLEIITEGTWIDVMNVVPTAIRYSEIQLSAGRQSVFSQSRHKDSEKIKLYTKTLKRTCYSIKDLATHPGMTTDYNEIDTVGFIFLIEPSIKDFDSNKHQFQNVYLTDAEKNMICINFWGGLKKFGFENLLDTGQVVSCTNLQKRAGNIRKSIPQYRAIEFSCFTKTPKNDVARKLIEDLSIKLSSDRVKFCEDCINLKNNSLIKLRSNAENISPYRFPYTDENLTRNRVYIDSPLTHKRVDDNLNLTGLDFESTFQQTQELSPKTLLRKRQVNEKIAKLKMYGEPPPLSPIQILNQSKNAGNAFKSPLISKSESSVASEIKIVLNEQNTDIQCSPVMDRTYVKRGVNVNPVKLNFSNSVAMEENVVDHFGEDFDCSPPLSLD